MKRFLILIGFYVFTFYHLAAIDIIAEPSLSALGIGKDKLFSIQVQDNIDFRGLKIVISYNANLINFESAQQGNLFSGYNVGWWNVDNSIPGIIDVECIIFGAGAYTSGPGNLLEITFSSLTQGSCILEFSEIILYDVDGNPIPNVSGTDFTIICGDDPSYASGKCFLQGAYESNYIMNTALLNSIPYISPYSQDPVAIDQIPADMVDWVLLELRTTLSGSAVKSQSMILHADGSITSLDLPVFLFWNTRPLQYYVVIYHRNHLPIISSSAIQFKNEEEAVNYNFTSALNVYGSGSVIKLENSLYGMIAGDANQDGNVFPDDLNDVWRLQVGQNGYLEGDFNLDGNVFPDDRNDLWRINSGKSTNVP